MFKLNQIINRDENQILFRTKHIVCKQVIIRQIYANEWKTTKNQMMIDISTVDMKEKEIECIEKQLEEYQDKFVLSECVSQINYFFKYSMGHVIHFILFVQCPLSFKVNEYFTEQRIGGNEKQIHISNMISIMNLMKRNGLISQLKNNWNDYSLALFSIPTSPYPMIQLTPFAFLHFLQSNYSNAIKKCNSMKEKENENEMNFQNNGYKSDKDNNVFLLPSESCQLSTSNSSEEDVVEWKENKEITETKETKEWKKDINENEQIEAMKEIVKLLNQNGDENCQQKQQSTEDQIDILTELLNSQKNTNQSSNEKDISLDNYEIVEKIGEGAFGKCVKAIDKRTGTTVVIKQAFDEQSDYLLKEKQIMQMCHHPNIINCHGYSTTFHDIENDQRTQMGSCLILEYCQYGDLQKYLQKTVSKNTQLSLEKVKSIFGQIAAACIYLYKTFGIIHRDIKLENFLISEEKSFPTIKLCDFGLSIKATKEMKNGVGSPMYAAPEIIRREAYDDTCDLYSLGIVLYYLVFNCFPFAVKSLDELMAIHRRNERISFGTFAEKHEYDDCLDLIEKLIVFQKNKRMKWDEFISHPFIVDCVSLL